MTQEEKQLLLKDLSVRLPYGIQAKGMYEEEADYNIPINHNETIIGHVDGIEHLGFDDGEVYIVIEGIPCELSDVCIYLRPMSSMTEEEFTKLKEYSELVYDQLDLASYQSGTYKCLDFYLSEVPSYVVILVFDWLNAHHFDYRGLIERGLAIEVTKENNPYKN